VLEEVKYLVRMGASVIRLHKREKRPIGNDWSDKPRLTESQLEKQYREGENLGIKLGEQSETEDGHIYAVDLDIRDESRKKEAFKELERLFDGIVDVWTLPRVRSGSGGESRHFYFVSPVKLGSRKLARSEDNVFGADKKWHKAWEVEFFGTGKQVALPPSVHPISGKSYKWEVPVDPVDGFPVVDADLLKELVNPESDEAKGPSEPIDVSYEEVREWLDGIDAEKWCEDRGGWIKLGMALSYNFHKSKEAFEVWDEFSRRSPKYDEKDTVRNWRSFRHLTNRPVTLRSIIKDYREAKRDAEFKALPGEFEDLEPEFTATADDFEDLEPAITATADDFEDLIDRPAKPAKASKVGHPKLNVPEHLLSVPGELQKAVEYYNATAMKDQPQFAVQTALAFGSVIAGRVWKTDYSNYSSLYFLNIGPTASGKEHANRVIDRLLEEASLTHLMGPKSYTSESGVISTLMEKPKHITIVDELGRMLSSVRETKGSLKQETITTLMEVFGRLDGTARSVGYSTHGKTKEQIELDNNRFVVRPALTFLAMTTPDTLFKVLGGMDVKDGFLNRFLIVESPLGRQLSREDAPRADVPKSLIDWARITATAHGGEEDDDMRMISDPKFIPVPREVPFSKQCKPILRQMEEEVIAEMNRLDEHGLAELYGRTREIAMRLSLIVAVSCNSSVVKREHLEWARDYVFFYHRQMADRFKTSLGKSEDEVIAEEVFAYLKKQGGEGAVPSEIARFVRSFRALDTRGRDEILIRVQSDMGVKHVIPEGKGHKTKRYFAPKR